MAAHESSGLLLLHLLSARVLEDLLGEAKPILVRVYADQDLALVDLVLVELGFMLRNTETDQGSGQSARRRAGAEPRERGDQRSGRNQGDPGNRDRTHRRKTGGNGSQHAADRGAGSGAFGSLGALLDGELTTLGRLGHEQTDVGGREASLDQLLGSALGIRALREDSPD